MKRTFSIIVLAFVALMALAAACAAPAPTPTPTRPPATATPAAALKASSASIATGGKLYDKWWTITGAATPKDNQPIWARQTTNTRTGGDTWRCKECHGWDYKGKDGAYGKGSHLTGFPGVLSAATTKSKDELKAILKDSANPQHNFTPQLGEEGITNLANFLKDGTADMAKYINYETKKPVSANTTKGKDLYDKNCAACHGADGKTLRFGTAEAPEYVGTIAADNPWEFTHKVMFGQPGAPMPSGTELGWSLQDTIDVLAHAQTLPTK